MVPRPPNLEPRWLPNLPIYIYMYIYMYVCIYICTYIYTYTHMHSFFWYSLIVLRLAAIKVRARRSFSTFALQAWRAESHEMALRNHT